jgi:DNA-binding SARP family transcriptional activator
MHDGRLDDAIAALEAARTHAPFLGGLHAVVNSRLVEALFLAGRHSDIPTIAAEFTTLVPDPRHSAESAAARAIGVHVSSNCDGECQLMRDELATAEAHGEIATAVWGRVKLARLALEHGGAANQSWAWHSIEEARRLGLWTSLKAWLRTLTRYAPSMLRTRDGAVTLAALSAFDPDAWRGSLVTVLPAAKGNDRRVVIEAISRTANRETLDLLGPMPEPDVAVLRRQLRYLQAPRLFLRTLGGVALHRASWEGPVITIDKKRVRMLLAVLAGHFGSILSRDVALEILWPEADPVSAVNSLNQTVFQLRRFVDPAYRGGESPEYVLSTSEQIGLNPELVLTDLAEIRKLPNRLAAADWQSRQSIASRAIKLVNGEFLADLRYEDWAYRQQMSIHSEIRECLLPIAQKTGTSYTAEVSGQAAAALLRLDPFDEAAILALADCLTQAGRRGAARGVIVEFLSRLESDLDLEPTPQFRAAMVGLGVVN